MPEMLLHALAHARAGDKGNRLNISLIAYAPELYPLLCDTVTEPVVQKLFAHRRPTAVKRYLLPKLGAMNFVLDGVLDGGVTQALNLDSHGKTLSFHLLGLKIPVPEELTVVAARETSKPPSKGVQQHPVRDTQPQAGAAFLAGPWDHINTETEKRAHGFAD